MGASVLWCLFTLPGKVTLLLLLKQAVQGLHGVLFCKEIAICLWDDSRAAAVPENTGRRSGDEGQHSRMCPSRCPCSVLGLRLFFSHVAIRF